MGEEIDQPRQIEDIPTLELALGDDLLPTTVDWGEGSVLVHPTNNLCIQWATYFNIRNNQEPEGMIQDFYMKGLRSKDPTQVAIFQLLDDVYNNFPKLGHELELVDLSRYTSQPSGETTSDVDLSWWRNCYSKSMDAVMAIVWEKSTKTSEGIDIAAKDLWA